jgi:hypothetical protein
MTNPGLLPDSHDPRDVFLDEIVSGSDSPLPRSYRTSGLKFEYQGAWPFCAAFATTTMSELAIRMATGQNWDFSQPHMFFRAGGTRNGSSFRANLGIATGGGCIPYARFPMPDGLYDLDGFDAMRDRALAEPFGESHVVPGYARVVTDRDALKRAVIDHGALLVGVAASGGYWGDRAKRPRNKPDNHAVLLVGWEEDDAWVVFDSLEPAAGFDGYHVLSPDYRFDSAYAVTGLPEDWKEIRDAARTPPANNASFYGKRRNLELEQRNAIAMLDEFRRFGNKSVLDAAGRFWIMLVNAVTYGGYSISYRKWGMWQPGDVINDIYSWRRTGKHLFDFDLPRDSQTL